MREPEVVLGGLEALPNRAGPPDKFVDEFGDRIALEPGRYRAEVHRLIGHHDEQVELEMASADTAVPSYIVRLRRMSDGKSPPHLERLPNFSPAQK